MAAIVSGHFYWGEARDERIILDTRAAKWEALDTALGISLPKLEESADGEASEFHANATR